MKKENINEISLKEFDLTSCSLKNEKSMMKSEQFLLWKDIQDIIGTASLWLSSKRKRIWTKKIRRFIIDHFLMDHFITDHFWTTFFLPTWELIF